MAQTYDMTIGNEKSIILRFFFPMFFTNMLQQIYTIADTAIVGKGIGDNALAAVGNMSSITFLIFGFAMGLSNGFSISTAHSFGEKNNNKLRHTIASSIVLSIIIAIVLTFVGIFFLYDILMLMQTDKKIIKDSLTYGYIIFGGLTMTIAYNLCSSILRALGDSRTPFIAIIISTIVNISLNYILICVVKTGVGGAAAATIAAQFISTVLCFNKLRRIEIIQLTKNDFQRNLLIYLELIRNGLPMAVMNSITAVGCVVVQYFVNGLGVIYTSAYSACSRYINLFMQPAVTSGFTMSSFTSQNYGAKRYDRIRIGVKICLTISLVSYILLGSIMVIFPEWLASLMLNGNKSIKLAAQFLPICGSLMFLVDFMFVFRHGVQAIGKPAVPMISGIVEMIMRIAVIVLLVNHIGFRATAFAEVGAWFSALLLNGVAFFVYINKKANNT